MPRQIAIGQHRYEVIERLGFNHDIGGYVAIVRAGGSEATVVKQGGVWRFWTPADRARPLIDYYQKLEEANA